MLWGVEDEEVPGVSEFDEDSGRRLLAGLH